LIRLEWPQILGSIVAAAIFVLVVINAFSQKLNQLGEPSPPLISEPAFGEQTGFFLLTFRPLDLVAISLVIFATVSCCVAMLRSEKGES